MNELALFAGAGGGLLASQLLGWKTVVGVEHNPYAAGVLVARQNDRLLPPFPIWDDVCTFDGTQWRGVVDVVSGGFPCQAYSTAAAGKNNADDLWPEMRRIVADVAPRYIFAENVSKAAIEAAAEDLEEMGYETKAVSLSAQDLGADHIRKRHWLLAYADNKSKLLCGINAKVGMCKELCHSVWESYSEESGMDDGMAGRMDRFKAIGNGQVPIVAAAAIILMATDERLI